MKKKSRKNRLKNKKSLNINAWPYLDPVSLNYGKIKVITLVAVMGNTRWTRNRERKLDHQK